MIIAGAMMMMMMLMLMMMMMVTMVMKEKIPGHIVTKDKLPWYMMMMMKGTLCNGVPGGETQEGAWETSG